MKNYRNVFVPASVLLVFAGAAPWGSAAEPALDVLFYGNSFSRIGGGIESIFQKVAVSAGQTRPNVVTAAQDGQTLAGHIASNTAVIGGTGSGSWDYVVLQEYSTKPTNITYESRGNPTGFKNDAQTLYNLVKANTATVKPVLFETWTRSPQNAGELPNYYPAQTVGHSVPYIDAANQMQSELTKYYYEARAQIGANVCRLAPVGDAFKMNNYDNSLYGSDWYHESGKGALLAAVIIYETIYGDATSDVTYAQMSTQLGLSNYGVYNASDWTALTTLADAAVATVPEPTSMALAGVGTLMLLRRRRILAPCRTPVPPRG